jgi:hypothetical protein
VYVDPLQVLGQLDTFVEWKVDRPIERSKVPLWHLRTVIVRPRLVNDSLVNICCFDDG